MLQVKTFAKSFGFVCLLCFVAWSGWAATVGDITTIQGERENEIWGDGIVIGLNGTGDKNSPDREVVLRNFINNRGIVLPAGVSINSKNSAIVKITGRLQPSLEAGQPVELTVSSVYDAKSLKNGTLLFTYLFSPRDDRDEKHIFATAQGAVTISEGVTETAGRVTGIVADNAPVTLVRNGYVHLQLKLPNFVDAARVANSINQKYQLLTKSNIAEAVSAGLVKVRVPDEKTRRSPVPFIADLRSVPLVMVDVPPRVYIDSRTNMITMNGTVEVSEFSFSYRDITVQGGQAATPRAGGNALGLYEPENSSNLSTVIRGLNSLGVRQDELVEIVKHIHKIGALRAELTID